MSTNIVSDCASLKQQIDQLRPLSAEQEGKIFQKLNLEWDFHSNHIEGNSLTYGETRALILHGLTAQGKPLKDHFEMTGHHEAVLWVEDLVKKRMPLTESVVRQLHELVLKEDHYIQAETADGQSTTLLVQVGQYKTTPNHVRTVTGETLFFSTPIDTPIHMRELMAWYANHAKDNALEVAAAVHHRFTRIHPFSDGNGRVARLISNFILMMGDYPPVIIKTQEKDSYYAALRLADSGDLGAFVTYLGGRLVESLDLVLRGARGEEIDDPDDVDKKFALLKQRFEGSSNRVNVVKTRGLAQKAWDDWIQAMFQLFDERSQRFQEFYLSRFVHFSMGGHTSVGPIEGQFSNAREKIGSLHELGATILFSGIKTREGVSHGFNEQLRLTLLDTHLEVFGGTGTKIAEAAWDECPDAATRLGWIIAEEKRHLEFLEKVLPK